MDNREKGKGKREKEKESRELLMGLDFGSRFVKLAYTKDFTHFGFKKLDTLIFYRDYFHKTPDKVEFDWPRLGLEAPTRLVVTGYGKHLFKDLLPNITEIRAHYLGACFQTGLTHFILLEVGGQDTKALYIKEGRVFDFLTNDKCAAGTGRYLENMARFLKMPWRQFTSCSRDPVAISNTCAIFGESELISHLLDGAPVNRLAAGVNDSVARRSLQMIKRFPCRTLVFVGGVARNRAVLDCLRRVGRYEILVPPEPQFNGAIGCCLEGRELEGRENGKVERRVGNEKGRGDRNGERKKGPASLLKQNCLGIFEIPWSPASLTSPCESRVSAPDLDATAISKI